MGKISESQVTEATETTLLGLWLRVQFRLTELSRSHDFAVIARTSHVVTVIPPVVRSFTLTVLALLRDAQVDEEPR